MRNNRIILVLLMISFFTDQVFAQLPSMDIHVKSGVSFIDDMRDKDSNLYSYVSPVIYGELNYNISQHFAFGLFYSKGFSGQAEFLPNIADNDSEFYNSSHQSYGIKLRASTGRQPRFRPFAEVTYGKLEMYIEKDFYRIANSSNYLGGALGLMIRLNSKFYLVFPQISIRSRQDPFFFEIPSDFALGSYPPMFEVTGGISYNLGKKK